MKSISDINKQVKFCNDLMTRLKNDIDTSAPRWSHLENYTARQNDIIRIRRELMRLSKMLGEW